MRDPPFRGVLQAGVPPWTGASNPDPAGHAGHARVRSVTRRHTVSARAALCSHRMRSAAPGWRRWSWRRPAKPRPGVKAPSMGAFHRPVRFHGRPRRRRPPSGSPSKCSALALHLHGKPPARCRRRPDRTASVWQCASCAERGTSTRRCRLASAGAALRPPSCSDQRAGSYCQETPVFVWSSSKYPHTDLYW